MSLTVTITPGFIFSSGDPGEELTYQALNLLGSPTISLFGAVSSAQLEDGAVTTAKIAPDAVTGAKIADNAIGLEHLEHLARGSLITFDASGPTELSVGPAGTILTSDGTDVSWESSASFSIYPGDLSSTLDRNTIDWDNDTIIVGDDSAGVAKKMDIAELVESNIYVQVCPALNRSNMVVAAFGGVPDAEETMPTMSGVTDSIGTSNAAQRNMTYAPFAGELIRITIGNNDPTNVLTCTAHLIKFDPADPYGGTTNNVSLGSHTVTTLAAFSTGSVDITSSNTWSAGDPLGVWIQTSAGSRPKVILTYRLSR